MPSYPTDNLLPTSLTAAAIGSYIKFDGQETRTDSSQALLQSEGVAALWYLLGEKGFAYLADEVGMGKTRQAMGVIAMQFLSDPSSHVVIICPGRTLQDQWKNEWSAFLRNCYMARDNRLRSALDDDSFMPIELHDRLRDFARSLLLNESRVHLLRYSSFSRPIWFGNVSSYEGVKNEYLRSLREIGINELDDKESAIFDGYANQEGDSWLADMTADLNEAYARRVGQLIRSRDIDLVVCDEAQYLRNLDNRQNTNLRHVFRTHTKKWLFLSATPLHSSHEDIRSLDDYLCTRHTEPVKAAHCKDCERTRCTSVKHRLDNDKDMDVVDLLRDFLVRRVRTYHDREKNEYRKVDYRKYERKKVSAAGDPFLAMTMALVQKRLVRALGGRNNQFRQGECSSFESLSSSLRRNHRNKDGVIVSDQEIDCRESVSKKDVAVETPDRTSIDALNDSFRKAMFGQDSPERENFSMPHAKLDDAANRIFQDYLLHGVNRKLLVFVRRLDSVEELRDKLLVQYQSEIDTRLGAWRKVFQTNSGLMAADNLWQDGQFWNSRSREDDEYVDSEAGDESLSPEDSERESLSGRIGNLPYFRALRRGRGGDQHGMLVSFQSRLLQNKRLASNPLKGFLLVPPVGIDRSSLEAEWQKADELWRRLVRLILKQNISSSGDSSVLAAWEVSNPDVRDQHFWKVATLKRCILQSLRQTDFVVDLYVLNRFLKQYDPSIKTPSLPEKLLWLLGDERKQELPEEVEEYARNWRLRLRQWFDHFDLIVDKSLREGASDWSKVMQNVDGVFARMAPVFGRSGRLDDKNAVKQFKLPVHPNVLVCTDVLKEGVDLHLFCDEVMHYGVAWTSGDLEQRIGRIDRVGSLINRRIGRHSCRAGDDVGLPRLRVEFPYLDGTLDKYQVERVIKEKIKSDLRLDLGKRGSEIGMISLDEIESKYTLIAQDDAVQQQNHKFYPKGVPTDDMNGGTLRFSNGAFHEHYSLLREQLQSIKESGKFGFSVAHLLPMDALCVRARIDHECGGMARSTRRGKGKKSTVYEVEYLVNIRAIDGGQGTPLIEAGIISAELSSLSKALRYGYPFGVSELPGAAKLEFSREWGTMIRQVVINNPFSEEKRSQTVLLEQVSNFWILRTPIFHELDFNFPVADAGEFVKGLNEDRDWGYLIFDQKIIWFVAFILDVGESVDLGVDFIEDVAKKVGKVGDRLQHLYSEMDEKDCWGYRSRAGFPPLPDFSEDTKRIVSSYKVNLTKMDQQELQQCGRLIYGIQAWFVESFGSIVATLSDVNRLTEEERPRVSPVMITSDGILHLQTLTAERFRLQAFLKLSGGNGQHQLIDGPCVIWELASSPFRKGTKPMLELSTWGALPHKNTEEWEGEINLKCSVFTNKGDKYRYLTLYHQPVIWDSNHREFIAAWGSALEKMQSPNNFMKLACRNLFSKIGSN